MTHYGMLIDLNRCIDCGSCVAACRLEHKTLKDVYWIHMRHKEVGDYPHVREAWIPMGCMHCEEAPCVKTCPTSASYHDEEGRVLIDYDRCIGCRSCMSSCPYGARHFNFESREEAPYWADEGFTELTPFETADTEWNNKHPKGVAEKCVLCYDRVAEGLLPACVQTCIAKARIFGDLDDPDSELVRAIHERDARPLNEEIGTKPSVYYVGEY